MSSNPVHIFAVGYEILYNINMAEIGKYLVVEGIDGAGKTTQAKILAEHLTLDGLSVVEMVEPGSTRIGQELRRIILDPDIELQTETELDLFTAVRRESVHQIIRPSTLIGKTVVSDRNWFSTVAYQGFGRDLDVDAIIEQTKRVMGEYFLPDGAVILDLPVEVAEARLGQSRAKADWFEREGKQFFDKVRRGYHWVAERFDVGLIDGAASIEAVHQSLYEHLGTIAID
jgi:dTMP kinase